MSNVLLSKPYFGRIVEVKYNKVDKEITVGVALYREPTKIFEKLFVADTNTYSEFYNFAGYFGIVDYDIGEIDLSKLIGEEVVVMLKEDEACGCSVDKIDTHKEHYDNLNDFKDKFNISDFEIEDFFFHYHGKDKSKEIDNRIGQPSYVIKCVGEENQVHADFLNEMSTYDRVWFMKKGNLVNESVETIQLEKPYFAKIQNYVVDEADNKLTMFVSPYDYPDSLFEYTINIKNGTGDEFNEFLGRMGLIEDDCIAPKYEILNDTPVICTFIYDENECQKVDFMDYIWECYLDPEEFQSFFNLKSSEMRKYFLGDVYKIYTYDVDGFRI